MSTEHPGERQDVHVPPFGLGTDGLSASALARSQGHPGSMVEPVIEFLDGEEMVACPIDP